MKFLLEISFDMWANSNAPIFPRAIAAFSFLALAGIVVCVAVSIIMALSAYTEKCEIEIARAMPEDEEVSACEEETAESEPLQ